MIGVKTDRAVATVTVDRPDAMNALDAETLTELKSLGVAEVFTPGAPTQAIVDFIRGAAGARASSA